MASVNGLFSERNPVDERRSFPCLRLHGKHVVPFFHSLCSGPRTTPFVLQISAENPFFEGM